MSTKHKCQPKTIHDIHKSLCTKPIIPRSKYELLGPNNHYRDENYELYKSKCDEFRSKVKLYKNENIKALQNHKKKLGELFEYMPEKVETVNGEVVEQERGMLEIDEKENLVQTKKESGTAFRQRHERPYNATWDTNEKLCNYEPWFRRYLILCKFIAAARKVIIKNRMLKNLAQLKSLTKESLQMYENQNVAIEQLTYSDLFQKFVEEL